MTVHKIYTLCFFLSGAAGLIYQIVWVRMFTLVFGNTVYAVSVVVAGFLSGLALGSYAWGKWIDTSKTPLKTYVRLELAIAISAIVISGLIHALDDTIVGFMTAESVGSIHWSLIRFASLFLILLIPTTLMGGTLPVMSKFYVTRFDNIGAGIGSLYAANTYGAMVGCFLSGYALIYYLGNWGALATAFVLNLLAAAMVWRAPALEVETIPEPKQQKKKTRKKKEKVPGTETVETPFKLHIPLGLALSLAAGSGFCALAYEILWTRAFIVSFKSTVYLFSNLLTVFLFGMALGSHFFSKKLDNLKDPVRLFGMAQVAIGIWGMISILFFMKINGMAIGLGTLFDGMSLTKDVFIMLVLMTLAFTFPAFLMGLSYPLICRVTVESLGSLGRYAGLTYAIGTLGGIVGSLMAGFYLLPVFGLQNSLFLISGLALMVGYIALLKSASRKGIGWVFPTSAAAALMIIVTVAISGTNIGLGVGAEGKVVFASEGVMGSVRVTQKMKNGPLTLQVNNYQLATSGDVAVRFGHIPLLLKPDAKDVLLISLGAGITAGAIGRHPVERIDCVEIVPTLFDVQYLFKQDNHNIIADKRFHLTFWDGRHFVRMTKRKYDLVVADLYQPDSAGVGSLYALEYYQEIKEKLKKGGAMAQWLPLYQLSPENLKVIMRTFATAFEHVNVFAGDINSELPTLLLFGSSEPIRIRPDTLLKSLENEEVKEDMIEHSDPMSFLSFYIMDRQGVLDFTEGSPINSDNRPVIEYTAPQNIWSRKENAFQNFVAMKENRQKLSLSTFGASEDTEFEKALDRYFRGRSWLLQGKIEHIRRNYPAEIESYKKAAKLVPSDPFLGLAVFDLGYLYYHRGDFNTASKIFEWVKKINKNLPEAYFYLGKSYQRLNMKEKSLAAFNELARLRPDITKELVSQ